VNIFPLSDPILLPLTPTIASTIADYLQLMARQVYVQSPHNYDKFDTESAQDWSWHWQCKCSIRLVTTSPYQYVSTIAYRLAAKSLFTPLEICQHLQPSIGSVVTQAHSALALDCWYNDAGYIYFQLTTEAIGKWLNYIHDLPLNLQLHSDRRSSVSMAVYAHARCCSLLKLAAAEQVVAITDDWQIVAPECSSDQSPQLEQICRENPFRAASNRLFEHPAEERLIYVLMRVLDSIYEQNWESKIDRQLGLGESEGSGSAGIIRQNSSENRQSPNWSKLTIDLAQSWLEFDRHCRIFGDVKSQNPRLAIARCELTAISRRYLQVLLENYLGINASIEL
jgi:hypothetical protein